MSRVSVIVPTFNSPTTLPRAISSILAQSGVETEIIVVDDCSVPPVEPADLPGGSVQVMRTPANAGAGPARNLGVEAATGDVVAFLDADDEWLPESLLKRVELCAPGRCAFGPYLERNDVSGSVRQVGPGPGDSLRLYVENLVAPSTLVIWADDFRRLGGFPADRRCAEDWVLSVRAFHAGVEFAAVSAPVCIKHVNTNNTTRDPRTTIDHALGAVQIMHDERLGTPEELSLARRAVRARAALWSANVGDLHATVHHARAAAQDGIDRDGYGTLARVPLQWARGVARRTLAKRREPRR